MAHDLASSFIAYRLLLFFSNHHILWAMKPQALLKAIGRRIRAIRKSRELSQERLAEMSDLHPTFVSDTENGKLNVSILSYYKIAEALKVPLPELFDVKSSPSIKKAKKKSR